MVLVLLLPGSGAAEYARAEALCRAAFGRGSSGGGAGCDHVMLMARDAWYGGLGDRVAIFTSSRTSGALALRHELGHVLADVGEEYDGGEDYSGPNFAETNRRCAAAAVAVGAGAGLRGRSEVGGPGRPKRARSARSRPS